VPVEAGSYTVTITKDGDPVSGSPFEGVLVLPGELDPAESSHSISAPPVTITAGVTYFFRVTTRDIYGNLVLSARNSTVIRVKAMYTHHDDWLSPLTGVPDLEDWDRIYGRDVAGLAMFKNDSQADPESSYVCQFTLYRAGTFSLEILLNGGHVTDSPLTDQILVVPA
jgi:hypothetical protein